MNLIPDKGVWNIKTDLLSSRLVLTLSDRENIVTRKPGYTKCWCEIKRIGEAAWRDSIKVSLEVGSSPSQTQGRYQNICSKHQDIRHRCKKSIISGVSCIMFCPVSLSMEDILHSFNFDLRRVPLSRASEERETWYDVSR